MYRFIIAAMWVMSCAWLAGCDKTGGEHFYNDTGRRLRDVAVYDPFLFPVGDMARYPNVSQRPTAG